MQQRWTSIKRVFTCFAMLMLFTFSVTTSQAQIVRGGQRFMFAPFTVLDAGPGVGFHYEFMPNKKMAVVLPGYLIFDQSPSHFRSDKDFISHYFVPGLKFYPAGIHKVTYGIGPSLMLGYGNKKWNENRNDVHAHRFRVGVIAMNYVDFHINNKFLIALEGGPGIRYVDHYWNKYRNVTETFELTGQFSVKLGFKF